MELVDEWGNVAARPGSKGLGWADQIRLKLSAFEPEVVSVQCYEDVGYPWVQVAFQRIIHPEVALQLGDVLATVDGVKTVYLNSLRPKAAYFVLTPSFADPPPDLEASRYGATLVDLRAGWA